MGLILVHNLKGSTQQLYQPRPRLQVRTIMIHDFIQRVLVMENLYSTACAADLAYSGWSINAVVISEERKARN